MSVISNLKKMFFSGGHRGEKKSSVYIPFDQCTSIGGPATFLKNLKAYFDRIGFTYVNSLAEASVILFPISYDLRQLKKFKKRGGLVCQRLDGIYYPEKNGADYVRRNKKIKTIYSEFADHIIFQSQYSRAQCFELFGPIPAEKYSIVVNGVNTDIFYPDRQRELDPEHIHFCTTGNIRNDDMLVPVIHALDRICSDVTFTFHVVGPVKNERCAELMSRDYIVHHDQCDMQQVAELLRASDVFIYSHLNPPCPNSVLEAIATGLPIVGYQSGSMTELLPFSIDLLADVPERIFHRLGDFHPEILAEKLLLSVKNYQHYRALSIQHWDTYSMECCGDKYAGVIQVLLNRR
jgi:glycosyltransferase involved in cell wall biosynthesis